MVWIFIFHFFLTSQFLTTFQLGRWPYGWGVSACTVLTLQKPSNVFWALKAVCFWEMLPKYSQPLWNVRVTALPIARLQSCFGDQAGVLQLSVCGILPLEKLFILFFFPAPVNILKLLLQREAQETEKCHHQVIDFMSNKWTWKHFRMDVDIKLLKEYLNLVFKTL